MITTYLTSGTTVSVIASLSLLVNNTAATITATNITTNTAFAITSRIKYPVLIQWTGWAKIWICLKHTRVGGQITTELVTTAKLRIGVIILVAVLVRVAYHRFALAGSTGWLASLAARTCYGFAFARLVITRIIQCAHIAVVAGSAIWLAPAGTNARFGVVRVMTEVVFAAIVCTINSIITGISRYTGSTVWILSSRDAAAPCTELVDGANLSILTRHTIWLAVTSRIARLGTAVLRRIVFIRTNVVCRVDAI